MRRLGPVSTLIEWDERIPELETLAAEAARAREILARVAREEECGWSEGARARRAAAAGSAQLITAPSGVEALSRGRCRRAARRARARRRGLRRRASGSAVYANAYFARLHDCLRGRLRRARARARARRVPRPREDLPDDATRRRARRCATPERTSPSISRRAPFAEIFARRCAYAADLARLEWAIARRVRRAGRARARARGARGDRARRLRGAALRR